MKEFGKFEVVPFPQPSSVIEIKPVPSRAELLLTREEAEAAQLTPPCIVENLLYADVAVMAAPGGTGKTTILLYEAVCVALGISLYGNRILSPGWTLFVTAEDQRERLAARLNEICMAMELSDDDYDIVLQNVVIWDVTGENRKFTHANGNNIELTALVDKLIEAHDGDRPKVINIDPMISFGCSEAMVNDNEQALITAARRIVAALGCCVRYVHHTGKANSGSASLGQYSARGGSALADGSRMMQVLQRFEGDADSKLKPPATCKPDPDSSITIYARPKLSHAAPNLPLIWIKRTGFLFEAFTDFQIGAEAAMKSRMDQIVRFLTAQLQDDAYYNTRQLNACCRKMDMSQPKLRPALAELEATGRIVSVKLPDNRNPSGRGTFLCPVELSGLHGSTQIPEKRAK